MRKSSGFTFPVAAKLAIINLLFVVALITVAAISWLALDAQDKGASRLLMFSTAQRLAHEAYASHEALRSSVLAALLAGQLDGLQRDEIVKDVRAEAVRLRTNLRKMAGMPLPPDVRGLREQINELAEQYVSLSEQLSWLALNNRPAALARMSEFETMFKAAALALGQQIESIAMRTAEAQKESEWAGHNARRWLTVAGLLTLMTVSLTIALVGRSIRVSLAKVRSAAQRVAEGDLSTRCDVSSRDEIGTLADAVNRMAENSQSMINRMRTEAGRTAFSQSLVEALEMADSETQVHRTIARAMQVISPNHPMELLLADSSQAHLERAAQHPSAGAPSCSVDSPFQCMAVRRGNPVSFPNGEALNACTYLRDRPCGAVSAVCVPVSFMGRALGVVHATGTVNEPLTAEQTAQLTTLGIQAGARVGTVRAFERSQLQAATDGMTGLLNRRMLERHARQLGRGNEPFAFVLGDVDHFKKLNDTLGHQAGDDALRRFTEVMRGAIRDTDLIARWGGEEFAALLPGASAADAAEWAARVRERLRQALEQAGAHHFTVSFGVTDSTMSRDLDDLLRLADAALYQAKDEGRDRAVIADPAKHAAASARHNSEQRAAVDIRLLAGDS